MKNLIVVDCQYDFIDGSLACIHGYEAVKNIVSYINSNNLSVFYTSDWHGSNHCSFTEGFGLFIACKIQRAQKYMKNSFVKLKMNFADLRRKMFF